MLQCQIWGRGTGNAGEWKALTQGTGEKEKNLLRRVSAQFFLSALPGIYMRQIKVEWGQTMACVKSGVVFPECRITVSVVHSHHKFCGALAS